MDLDGQFEYSAVEVVQSDGRLANIQIFPNPVSEVLHVQVNDHYENGQYHLYDKAGKLLLNNSLNGPQNNSIRISDLPDGTYYLHLTIDGTQVTENIVIQ